MKEVCNDPLVCILKRKTIIMCNIRYYKFLIMITVENGGVFFVKFRIVEFKHVFIPAI